MTPAASLRRVQWAVRLALTLGVAASVTANILHAEPNPIAQAIAAWPPLALLIAVELVSRIPIHHRVLSALRITATAAIAGIAAWVSYRHMVGVVARYGETGSVPYLLPLSVDGLIIVASVSLIELAGRIRDLAAPVATATQVAPAIPSSSTEPTPPAPSAAGANHAPTGPDRVVVAAASSASGRASAGSRPLRTNTHADGQRPRPPEPAFGVPADLVPLLPAARALRDQLASEGRVLSRDALAAHLRASGHPIRNNRVSELLTALKAEASSINGSKQVKRG